MTGKIIGLLKDGNIVIPKLLFTNYRKFKITDSELIVLIYLLNDNEFNPERISNDLGIKIKDILNIIDSLTKKDIICLNSVVNNNICGEYVSFDNLYNKLALVLMSCKSSV